MTDEERADMQAILDIDDELFKMAHDRTRRALELLYHHRDLAAPRAKAFAAEYDAEGSAHLLPCPLCGEAAAHVNTSMRHPNERYQVETVECRMCECTTGGHAGDAGRMDEKRQAAADDWNRRWAP